VKRYEVEIQATYRHIVTARDEDHAWELAEDCDPEDFGAVCLESRIVNVSEREGE
jgi:hypothetical protein